MKITALTISAKRSALGACPVFSGVAADELALLAEIMQTERLLPGEILFEAGDVSGSVYVVASGTLDVFLAGKPGVVRKLETGELLGEYGMFSNLARTATVQAGSEVVLLSLDYQHFRTFLLRFPEAMLVVLKTTVERLIAAERRGQINSSV